MRCSRYREALSARFDDEEPGIPIARIEAHLEECDACRSWAAAAGALTDRLGNAAPDVAWDPAVTAALLEGTARDRRRLSLGHWRGLLAMAAIVQLVVAWPGVMLQDGHAEGHVARELTSWDLGLAVAFLVLAWLPSRAWGALPVVAVMVAFLSALSITDVATGHAQLASEAVHALQVAALACLWVLAQRLPRMSVVLRLPSP
jgi:predicted anti-sigma-YlaC factor YlaD